MISDVYVWIYAIFFLIYLFSLKMCTNDNNLMRHFVLSLLLLLKCMVYEFVCFIVYYNVLGRRSICGWAERQANRLKKDENIQNVFYSFDYQTIFFKVYNIWFFYLMRNYNFEYEAVCFVCFLILCLLAK